MNLIDVIKMDVCKLPYSFFMWEKVKTERSKPSPKRKTKINNLMEGRITFFKQMI